MHFNVNIKMYDFELFTVDVPQSLCFCLPIKRSTAESHRTLCEAYGNCALSEWQCRAWFHNFQSGDFDICNEERDRPTRKFKDSELEAILSKDDTLSQQRIVGILKDNRTTTYLTAFASDGKNSQFEKEGTTSTD